MAKRGRPPFKPTPTLRRTVEQMVALGESQETIARALACDPDTLRKHFPEELAKGAAIRRREAIDLLFKSARKGNVSAIKRVEELTRAGAAAESIDQAARPAKELALGKKERAAIAATTAGAGTEWGDDLRPPDAKVN